MTQQLKDAIDALQSLEALPENEQENLASKIIGLVESAKMNQEHPWGSLWSNMTANKRSEEFLAWVDTKS